MEMKYVAQTRHKVKTAYTIYYNFAQKQVGVYGP